MKTRLLIGILGIGIGLLVGSPFAAAHNQILQLEIEAPTENEAIGWRGVIRQWLGAKVIRPKTGTKLVVQSSAYASSPRQTDSTPCITAAGTRVRPGVVATNFLPMGTLLLINGQIHIVEDRMNSRYSGKQLDVWFPSTEDAFAFGRKKLEIEIVGYGKPGQELSQAPSKKAPSALKRAQQRFVAMTQNLAAALSAKVSGDVNRFDVDCDIPVE